MARFVPSPGILLTAGGVAVAALAYAVGGQSADGTAGAATSARPAQTSTTSTTDPRGARGRPGHRRGRVHDRGASGPALAEAARALGVPEAQLLGALRELRPALRRGNRRPALAAAIATATGAPVARVESALRAGRPGAGVRTARFEALAKELGVSAARVRAAWEAVEPERRARRRGAGGRGAFLTALAGELGVTRAELGRALGAVGPGSRRRGDRGGRGLDTAALATALGTTQAKVRQGVQAFRAAHEKERTALRAAFVEQLAARLGVPEARVEAVAKRVLPRGGRGPGRP